MSKKIVEKPNISIVTILHDNTDFYPLLQHHWDTLDYPKDKLEWIIIDDSKEDHNNQLTQMKDKTKELQEKLSWTEQKSSLIPALQALIPQFYTAIQHKTSELMPSW